jgi:phosphoribosylformimino-5-aminoimidazole carboxamide ribotide isomerase
LTIFYFLFTIENDNYVFKGLFMYLLPAIDLRSGKCVRLIQGDYSRQINYEDDPVKQAKAFAKAGAEWLHVVDLDGASQGYPVNTFTVATLACESGLKIEVGGGVREESDIQELLSMGAERVIIGTKAVSDFDWFSSVAHKFPHKLALGLDARGSKVSTHGWTQETSKDLIGFAKHSANLPIAAIIYTDITKDGMMAGPNLERTKALAQAVDVPIIASGGVTAIDDILSLAKANVAGAIVGRALYEEKLDLAEAIKALRAFELKINSAS